MSTLPIDNIKDLLSIPTELLGLGVVEGYAGVAVMSGILFKQTQDAVFETYLQQALTEISDHVSSVVSVDFEKGIAGIGWSIEWLCQQNILKEINTDEVLEDFDDRLYKEVVFRDNPELGLLDGTLGLLNYFSLRNKSRNKASYRYRKLINRECYTILEDRINEHIKSNNDANNTRYFTLLADILRIALPSYNVLNTDKDNLLNNCLALAANSLQDGLQRNRSIRSSNEVLALLYLAIQYRFVANKISDTLHQHQAKLAIDMLNETIESDRLLFEKSQLINLLRVQMLLCIHEKNDETLGILARTLHAVSCKDILSFSLSEKSSYIYAQLVLNGCDLSIAMQDLIFTNLDEKKNFSLVGDDIV